MTAARSAARQAFIQAEHRKFDRFLDGGGGGPIVSWSRTYSCDCGFRCTSSGDIWDHVCASEPEQQELPL